MSDRELITEYKHTILELTQEKKNLNKLIEEKDAKIKKILIQLEQANSDIHSAGKKLQNLRRNSIKNKLSKE